MAKKARNISTVTREGAVSEVIDLQIHISPRGRSVMNGTLLVDGVPQTFHRDLGMPDVKSLATAVLGIVFETVD